MICPNCQHPATGADALFCAQCGQSLQPPTTVVLPEPVPVPEPEPKWATAAPTATREPVDNRNAAIVGLAGAALVVVGAFQVWLRIRIDEFIPPGSAETGWKGGDGRTIVVAGAVAAIAALALLLGRRELWLKVALLISGGVTVVIALVNMVDAGSKARDIELQFGIPPGDVRAQVGIGLYIVASGGIGLLAAGLGARTSAS